MPDYPNLPPVPEADCLWSLWAAEYNATCDNCGSHILGQVPGFGNPLAYRGRQGDPIAKARDGRYLCERCFQW